MKQLDTVQELIHNRLCPKCRGRGKVVVCLPGDVYAWMRDSTSTDTCSVCKGAGVVRI